MDMDEAENARASRTAPTHARSPRSLAVALALCTLLGPALASAQTSALEGRWIVFDHGGHGRFVVEVQGVDATLEPLAYSGSAPTRLMLVPGPVADSYRLQEVGGREVALAFAAAGGQNATIVGLEDGDLSLAYRLQAIAPALDGVWSLAPPEASTEFSFTVDATAGTLVVGLPDGARTGTAEGFAMSGTGPCLLAVVPEERPQPLCFVPAGAEVWLVVPPGEAEYAVAYRPGATPPWLDQVRASAQQPSPGGGDPHHPR